MFTDPPETFKSGVKNLYSMAFKAHQALNNKDETLEEGNIYISVVLIDKKYTAVDQKFTQQRVYRKDDEKVNFIVFNEL